MSHAKRSDGGWAIIWLVFGVFIAIGFGVLLLRNLVVAIARVSWAGMRTIARSIRRIV
jgi:hypothetical protein